MWLFLATYSLVMRYSPPKSASLEQLDKWQATRLLHARKLDLSTVA